MARVPLSSCHACVVRRPRVMAPLTVPMMMTPILSQAPIHLMLVVLLLPQLDGLQLIAPPKLALPSAVLAVLDGTHLVKTSILPSLVLMHPPLLACVR